MIKKRRIKIKFVDFWDNQNHVESGFYKLLNKRFEIELSDNPDYIIFSVFGYEHLNYECIRIFFTGELYSPDFDIADYAIGYEFITYTDRYFRFPLFALTYNEDELMEIDNISNINDVDKINRDFCSFVYSNPNQFSRREIIFYNLNQYKRVNSGGSYLNNIGYKVRNKLEFESSHKFSIAFENCVFDGYTTEKLFQSIYANTIPIYYGNSSINEYINTENIINCHEFEDFNGVIERVKAIDNDDNLYIKMLRGKKLKPKVYKLRAELLDYFESIFERQLVDAIRRPQSPAYYSKIRRYRVLMRVYNIYKFKSRIFSHRRKV
jgi:alpha(1,3/1,4) fucosyltransferase